MNFAKIFKNTFYYRTPLGAASESSIDTLKEQLDKFNLGGLIFVSRNFNSRLGTEQDFKTESKTDLKYLLEGYELHIFKSNRNNLDI